MGYIYMLIDTRNDKKYIGKHNGLKKDYWSSGLVPNRIAKMHGKDIFNRVILEDNISNETLNEKEIYYIKKYDTFKNGYNSTIGGDGGGEWVYSKSKEELEKISKIKSEKLTGRIFSKETKNKMSESAKIKKFTQTHKDNIGKAVKKRGGYPHSEETKNKLSLLMKGRKNNEHSKFMVENNPMSRGVSVNGETYISIAEACRILGVHRKSVAWRVKSEKEKYKDWFFMQN
jgi:group I intron endonuclease